MLPDTLDLVAERLMMTDEDVGERHVEEDVSSRFAPHARAQDVPSCTPGGRADVCHVSSVARSPA